MSAIDLFYLSINISKILLLFLEISLGTHEELLKTCDTYYQIAASQLSESELKEAMKEED